MSWSFMIEKEQTWSCTSFSQAPTYLAWLEREANLPLLCGVKRTQK